MMRVLAACSLAIAVCGCSGFPEPPVELVDSGPFVRDAAAVEHGLIRENKSSYYCEARTDASILCQGVRQKVR